MQPDQDALVRLLDRLLAMRRELVDRLAEKLDGGAMALLSSVDGAAAATEAEIEARRGDEGSVAAYGGGGEVKNAHGG